MPGGWTVVQSFDWTDGDVSYQIRIRMDGAHVLSAIGPGISLRTVSLRSTDGGPHEWRAMTVAQRTLHAERILQRA